MRVDRWLDIMSDPCQGNQVLPLEADLHDDEEEALVSDLALLVESSRGNHLLNLGFQLVIHVLFTTLA